MTAQKSSYALIRLRSGACSLLIGFLFGGRSVLVVIVALAWGVVIVADSAQLSTSVTELGDPAFAGTALTTQVALGFLLTLASIRLVPALGSLAMWRLRARPEAARLAGGMR